MLRPQKYCWFPRNGKIPTTALPVGHRTDHYVNKLEVVNVLNVVIDKYTSTLTLKTTLHSNF